MVGRSAGSDRLLGLLPAMSASCAGVQSPSGCPSCLSSCAACAPWTELCLLSEGASGCVGCSGGSTVFWQPNIQSSSMKLLKVWRKGLEVDSAALLVSACALANRQDQVTHLRTTYYELFAVFVTTVPRGRWLQSSSIVQTSSFLRHRVSCTKGVSNCHDRPYNCCTRVFAGGFLSRLCHCPDICRRTLLWINPIPCHMCGSAYLV